MITIEIDFVVIMGSVPFSRVLSYEVYCRITKKYLTSIIQV